MAETSTISINMSPNQYYSCTACGKCCETPWKVEVSPEELERIEKTAIFQRIKQKGYVPIELADENYKVGRRDDDSCHFLGDKGCGIHNEEGFAAKPSVCKTYPFGLINTPDGYFVSLAFSCPAVLAGTGEPVSKQVDDLKMIVETTPYYGKEKLDSSTLVTVAENQKLSWSSYLQVEDILLKDVGKDDPIGDLLSLATSLALHMNSSSEDPWVYDSSIYDNPLIEEVTSLLPMFAANTIAVMELDENPEGREEFTEEIQQSAGVQSSLLGKPLPQFYSRKPDNMIVKNVLLRFVRNAIWGKKLISGPTVVTRLLMLAASVSVVLYYLEARGQGNKRHHFDFEHLEWAFDLVESAIFTHADDLKPMFLEYELSLIHI